MLPHAASYRSTTGGSSTDKPVDCRAYWGPDHEEYIFTTRFGAKHYVAPEREGMVQLWGVLFDWGIDAGE